VVEAVSAPSPEEHPVDVDALVGRIRYGLNCALRGSSPTMPFDAAIGDAHDAATALAKRAEAAEKENAKLQYRLDKTNENEQRLANEMLAAVIDKTDAESRLAEVERALRSIEWRHEVDVNGEYVTTKWRDPSDIKAEIDRILRSAETGEA
jgi:hypothetical protein